MQNNIIEKGIIYLIQPCELLETNHYKIGCSVKQGLNRIKNGYKRGTKILHVAECKNPFELEGIIKKEFNKKFKLIAGNEFYRGNEKSIIFEFKKIIDNYNNIKKNKIKQNNKLKNNDENLNKEEQNNKLQEMNEQLNKKEQINELNEITSDENYSLTEIHQKLLEKIQKKYPNYGITDIISLDKQIITICLTYKQKLQILNAKSEAHLELSNMIYINNENNYNLCKFRNILITTLSGEFCKVYDDKMNTF